MTKYTLFGRSTHVNSGAELSILSLEMYLLWFIRWKTTSIESKLTGTQKYVHFSLSFFMRIWQMR